MYVFLSFFSSSFSKPFEPLAGRNRKTSKNNRVLFRVFFTFSFLLFFSFLFFVFRVVSFVTVLASWCSLFCLSFIGGYEGRSKTMLVHGSTSGPFERTSDNLLLETFDSIFRPSRESTTVEFRFFPPALASFLYFLSVVRASRFVISPVARLNILIPKNTTLISTFSFECDQMVI